MCGLLFPRRSSTAWIGQEDEDSQAHISIEKCVWVVCIRLYILYTEAIMAQQCQIPIPRVALRSSSSPVQPLGDLAL
jgi:hypothetical protein